MAEIIAFHSGQSLEKVESDLDRDYLMTPEEAKAYGLIDDIIVPTRGLWATTTEPSEPPAEHAVDVGVRVDVARVPA